MFDEFKSIDPAGERKHLHCVRCKRATIHTLEALYEGKWNDEEAQIWGGEKHGILRCGACDAVCFETISWDSEDWDHDHNGESFFAERASQFPPPASSHFNFDTAATPGMLDRILDEMLYALAGSKLILATIGLRLSVEFIVNDKKCKGRTLADKIDDLKVQGLIDDDQLQLLHLMRTRGNKGAHEAHGMSLQELIAAMSIVDGLLEKLYNGPARHEATIKNAKRFLKSD
ncbi:MAG: DUF4145 domain-containing protein [Pseudomonadota bacterium]